MFRLALASFCSFLLFVSCASNPDKKEGSSDNSKEKTVGYYYGNVTLQSGTSKKSFGITQVLLKRIVDPATGQITEFVLRKERPPKKGSKEVVTHMQRRGTSDIFDATDMEKSFTGAFTFSGEEWKWKSWLYDVQLQDGSRLKGQGKLDEAGIHSQETIRNKLDVVTLKIIEDLLAIDETTYNQRHEEILRK